MFGDNIIPDDMLDGFYSKKKLKDTTNNKVDTTNNKVDTSNNLVDASNNLVDASNNPLKIQPIQKNVIYRGGGGDPRLRRYIIRPIDREGNMVKKFWDDF
jgi:hypothetical protein